MATLEPMASAKEIEAEMLTTRRDARATYPVQDYSQPDDQAELETLKEFLVDMNRKLAAQRSCEMHAFRINGSPPNRLTTAPFTEAKDVRPATPSLISESFHPPKLDVTVGAEAIDQLRSAPYWEWLREDGKWCKFPDPVQQQLSDALQPGVEKGSVEFTHKSNPYTVEFTVTTGPYTGQSADHPAGTPWWVVEATQTNNDSHTTRPVRLCDASCLLSVPQWYERIPSSGATPASIGKKLTPLKEFKMKPGTDDNGVLRWMHDDHGFVFRLKDTLSTLPAEYFDKADWEPMISDVLMEASEIIGHQDWPNELGFGEFDTLSKDVLSSGVQADHAAGVLISSMGDFMAQHKKRTKHLRKCTGEVTEKLEVVKSKDQKLKDLEELNRTIDDYEFADEGDERLELAPKLKALLESFDYSDGLDDPESLLIAYEDFQDGSAVTAGRIDEELLAARIDLMRVLAKLAVSVKERVDIMEKMLPEVEEKAKKIQTDSAKLCETLQSKSDHAKHTLELTYAEVENTRNKMKQCEDTRTAKRLEYESELNNLHGENDTLMNEIQQRMEKLYANEVEIRRKTMCNRGDEASHQKKLAECEQNLACLAGCQDEMEKFVVTLDTTKTSTQQVAKCAELMLVKHPQSIANNIKKDIEQTQDTGRAHDAMHFDAYCAAWSKTLEDETFVKAEKADIDSKIDQVKSDFISARRGKNEAKIKSLKEMKRQLIEQKQRQDEKLTKFKHQMETMHECDGEHKPPDDSEACYCVKPVLERLSRLQKGLCHPVDDHKRWYQLGADDQFIDQIKPWVTHQCSPQCFKEDGSLKPDLDGLSGTNGQPPHANGAVSLPPLDPRPELKRAVMREAMKLIAADVERDEQAAKEALAKKKAAISGMMPGIKLLGDAPDSGAMSRQSSKKKKAVLRVLEQPAEGTTGFSRRAGGGAVQRGTILREPEPELPPQRGGR